MATLRVPLLGLGLVLGLATTVVAQETLPCNTLCRIWLGRPSLDAPEEPAAHAQAQPVSVPPLRSPYLVSPTHHIGRESAERRPTRPRRVKISLARRQPRADPVAVIQPVSAPLAPAVAPPPAATTAPRPGPAVLAVPPSVKPATGDVPAALLD